jgi:predicted hydrocarbon binding protein
MSNRKLSPQETVIASISNAVTFMMGAGSKIAMREAGKQASRAVWSSLPEKVSFEEAARIMYEGIASLEGFGEFQLTQENDDGSYEITFKDCGFAQFTTQSGQPCGEQAICYFGFGLVEETLFRMTGKKVQVKLIERDDACGVCHERAIPR